MARFHAAGKVCHCIDSAPTVRDAKPEEIA